jgi:hypothetical protein
MTFTLTCVYFILTLAGPFAIFHQHQMPIQETSHPYGHELHDSSCDKHTNAHVHLSDHCAACQFTSLKQSASEYIWNTLAVQSSAEQIFFYFILPASQPHLSLAPGRAPPSFLS